MRRGIVVGTARLTALKMTTEEGELDNATGAPELAQKVGDEGEEFVVVKMSERIGKPLCELHHMLKFGLRDRSLQCFNIEWFKELSIAGSLRFFICSGAGRS